MRVIKYWRVGKSGHWNFGSYPKMEACFDAHRTEREALKSAAAFYARRGETDIRFEPLLGKDVKAAPKTVVRYWYNTKTRVWFFSTADLLRADRTTKADFATSATDVTTAKSIASRYLTPGAEFVEIPFVEDVKVTDFSGYDALSFGRAVHERLEQMHSIADQESARAEEKRVFVGRIALLKEELAEAKSSRIRAELDRKREYERATAAENDNVKLRGELNRQLGEIMSLRGQISELKAEATMPPETKKIARYWGFPSIKGIGVEFFSDAEMKQSIVVIYADTYGQAKDRFKKDYPEYEIVE